MRSVALSVFIAFFAAPLARGRQHSTFRVRAQANASSGPVFSSQLKFLGRTVTIDRRVADGKVYIAAVLTAGDVERLKKDQPARK